jgi:hypothetical protein
LTQSNPDIQIHVFPSRKSDGFLQYLTTTPIHFVMAHDGALSMTGAQPEEHDADRRAMVLLRENILWFNTYHGDPLNVALINRIEFRDSKVGPPFPF